MRIIPARGLQHVQIPALGVMPHGADDEGAADPRLLLTSGLAPRQSLKHTFIGQAALQMKSGRKPNFNIAGMLLFGVMKQVNDRLLQSLLRLKPAQRQLKTAQIFRQAGAVLCHRDALIKIGGDLLSLPSQVVPDPLRVNTAVQVAVKLNFGKLFNPNSVHMRSLSQRQQ